MTPTQFSKTILQWFDQHGRKNLPWQQNINPYRVWISEIMLQQTQVTTVIPYFQRFMEQFPNLESLAKANENKVLNLWTGLGYYARARNLHRTAKIIHEKFSNKFPTDINTLQELPGIGRSTAGAILAIAMNQPTPILDGNVKRVLTRFHAVEGYPGKTEVSDKLWEIASRYTPEQRTAGYTQAIMDLGATICVRSKPQCDHCPLIKDCQAFTQNRITDFPARNPKQKKLPVRQIKMLLIHDQNNTLLLQKRPPTGIWGSLWSFLEFATDENINDWFVCNYPNSTIKQMQTWQSFRHTFSHFHLDITPCYMQIDRQNFQIMDSETQVWYKVGQDYPGGLASPVKKLLLQIEKAN